MMKSKFLIWIVLVSAVILMAIKFIPQTKQSKTIRKFSKTEKSNKEKILSRKSEVSLQKITGKTLFMQNCAVCHGKNKQGQPPAIPSLVDISERLSKQEILTILKNGKNGMPSFAHLSIDERKALADYLEGKNTTITNKYQLTGVEQGQRLFKANCAVCHKTQTEDSEPPGQKPYGMKPPVLGGINKELSFNQFERILNKGPWYMPSFKHLNKTQKQNIFDYLKTFPYRPNHRRNRCGGGRCGGGMKCR